jgi:predicted transcriptional regulator
MRGLGELEAAVMERLWARATPSTVRDVHTDLQRDRQIAYTTVMTVMDKLFKKGVLRRELDGRAYRYTPVLDQADYSADLMRQALDAGSDHAAVFLRFLQRMTPDESAALAEAYRRITGRQPT